jgi:hypothetical protein
MPDIVVPNGGTTDDQTPEVRIMLNGPLWPGSEVRVRRNGVDVGAATQLSSTEFVFVDNVTDGAFGQTVLSAQKSGIKYTTQLLLGQFVEFEFYATTEDRNISKLVPLIEMFNVGT